MSSRIFLQLHLTQTRMMYLWIVLVMLGISSVTGTTVGSEYSCSRFEYEEKVLEKMIRMEVEMDALKRQVLSTKQPFLDCQRDLNKAKLDWLEIEQRNSKLGDQLAELKSICTKEPLVAHYQEPVAFHAELTKSVSGPNHRLIFDSVKLNHGNAYNPENGSFVAPTNGTYQFDVTACSISSNHFVLKIHVNRIVFGKLLAGDGSYTDCNSKLFLVQLTVGDDVFVYHADTGNFLAAFTLYGLPTFSGVCLRSDKNN